MTNDDDEIGTSRRRRAEEMARAIIDKDPSELSPEEVGQVLNELVVHQIELEMQNAELRRTQEALDASRTRYFELYDLAPVGYLSLSEDGKTLEANLTAARMLGVPRGHLVDQPLSKSIFIEDQDTYYLNRKSLLETGGPITFELRLQRAGGEPFWARLDATARVDERYRAIVMSITFCDVTEQRRTEERLRQAEKLIALYLPLVESGEAVPTAPAERPAARGAGPTPIAEDGPRPPGPEHA